MTKQYKTYKGRRLDMDELRLKHEKTVAAGNMGVNAAGDKLGSGGEVIEPAQARVRKHYKATQKTQTTTSLKGPSDEDEKAFEQATKAPTEKKNAKGTKRSPKSTKVERETEGGDIILEEKAED